MVALAFLLLPLAGLVIRAPWGRFTDDPVGRGRAPALWLSLWTATVATVIAVVLGVPARVGAGPDVAFPGCAWCAHW